jgi:hypothetical protein
MAGILLYVPLHQTAKERLAAWSNWGSHSPLVAMSSKRWRACVCGHRTRCAQKIARIPLVAKSRVRAVMPASSRRKHRASEATGI